MHPIELFKCNTKDKIAFWKHFFNYKLLIEKNSSFIYESEYQIYEEQGLRLEKNKIHGDAYNEKLILKDGFIYKYIGPHYFYKPGIDYNRYKNIKEVVDNDTQLPISPNIKIVECRHSDLKTINQTFPNLRCLTIRDSYNYAFLGELKNLTSLKIFDEKIDIIAGDFPVYGSLRDLYVNVNHFDLDYLKNTPNLRKLRIEANVFGNNGRRLISNLNNLESLQISDPDFSAREFFFIYSLQNLEFLYLAFNGIRDNYEIKDCKNLKRLNIECNYISRLRLTNCPSIEILDCSNNRIESIETLGNYFPKLKRLNISRNIIQTFNAEFFENLEILWMRFCHLEKIPTGIKQLNHLKKLDLSDNNIMELPVWLFDLPALEEIYIANNPISNLEKYKNKKIEIIHNRNLKFFELIR